MPMHDLINDELCTQELYLDNFGLHRASADRKNPITTYKRHLLHLGE